LPLGYIYTVCLRTAVRLALPNTRTRLLLLPQWITRNSPTTIYDLHYTHYHHRTPGFTTRFGLPRYTAHTFTRSRYCPGRVVTTHFTAHLPRVPGYHTTLLRFVLDLPHFVALVTAALLLPPAGRHYLRGSRTVPLRTWTCRSPPPHYSSFRIRFRCILRDHYRSVNTQLHYTDTAFTFTHTHTARLFFTPDVTRLPHPYCWFRLHAATLHTFTTPVCYVALVSAGYRYHVRFGYPVVYHHAVTAICICLHTV